MAALGDVTASERGTAPTLADQFLYRLEFIHSKNIVHGDIQPGNLMMGLDWAENRVLWTHFGIAHQPRFEEGQSHAALKRVLYVAILLLPA